MYGLINQGLKDLIQSQYGGNIWNQIQERAELETDHFLRMTPYPDEFTYKLIDASADVLALPHRDVQIMFGRHWMRFTSKEGLGDFFEVAGGNVFEFLRQIDEIHTRLRLNFSQLQSPSFRCFDVSKKTLRLEYYSHREGLSAFVIGLLHGVAEWFDTPVEVVHQPKKGDEQPYDIFLITMKK